MEKKIDRELDCRKMNCPLPVIKTKAVIDTMASGEVLKLITDITLTGKCLPAWSSRTGNPILQTEQIGAERIYYIRCK